MTKIPTGPLRSAFANGTLIPWVGSGLSSAILGSAEAKSLPGFRGIISYLADEAQKDGFIDAETLQDVRSALDVGDFGGAATLVRQKVPPQVFGRMMWEKLTTVRPKSSQHHLMLNLMQFPIYLTTNYDWVLEDIIRPRSKVLTYRDHETLSALVNGEMSVPGDSPFIFKLNGDLSTPSTIVLGQAEKIGLYDQTTDVGSALRATLTQLMQRHSILFLGYSFDAPGYRRMLCEIGHELGDACQPHFAVLPEDELEKVPERDLLTSKANVSFFNFALDDEAKDGDKFRGLWQFLSQIPDIKPDLAKSLQPKAITRSFFLVNRRTDYLEMQNEFETKTTGFRFLTPTLTNALSSAAFLDQKTPKTLREFEGLEGIDDWDAWKDAVIEKMKARAATFRKRMREGAEARILCFETNTIGAIEKAGTESDLVTLDRFRLSLELYDALHQDIEVRFMSDTIESRSLMSYASLIRLNDDRSTDVGVAYASQATTSEFHAHVFEMNTEFSRDMLVTFEREWARALPLEESMTKLRDALGNAGANANAGS